MKIHCLCQYPASPYLVTVAGIILLVFLIAEKPWISYSKKFISLGFTLIGLFYSGLLAFSFKNRHLRSTLSLHILSLSGKYSYGIYVYHAIVINSAKYYYPQYVHDHRTLAYLTILAITFILSYLSYHSLEKFFLKMKPSFSNK